jgi:hypothetical protein
MSEAWSVQPPAAVTRPGMIGCDGEGFGDRFAFEPGGRVGEGDSAGRRPLGRQAGEEIFAGGWRLAEPAQQPTLGIGQHVDDKAAAGANSRQQIAAEADRHGNQRWIEAGLHRPTGEHRPVGSLGLPRDNEQPARDAAEGFAESFGALRGGGNGTWGRTIARSHDWGSWGRWQTAKGSRFEKAGRAAACRACPVAVFGGGQAKNSASAPRVSLRLLPISLWPNRNGSLESGDKRP